MELPDVPQPQAVEPHSLAARFSDDLVGGCRPTRLSQHWQGPKGSVADLFLLRRKNRLKQFRQFHAKGSPHPRPALGSCSSEGQIWSFPDKRLPLANQDYVLAAHIQGPQPAVQGCQGQPVIACHVQQHGVGDLAVAEQRPGDLDESGVRHRAGRLAR